MKGNAYFQPWCNQLDKSTSASTVQDSINSSTNWYRTVASAIKNYDVRNPPNSIFVKLAKF